MNSANTHINFDSQTTDYQFSLFTNQYHNVDKKELTLGLMHNNVLFHNILSMRELEQTSSVSPTLKAHKKQLENNRKQALEIIKQAEADDSTIEVEAQITIRIRPRI